MASDEARNFAAPYRVRSKTTGMRLLLLAADKGDANAQFNLGIVYDNNLDDNNHPAQGNRLKSIKWLTKAARQGLPRAQSKLAELYAGGPGAPKNDIMALAWFALAAQGSVGASRHRAQSGYMLNAARMTDDQIAQAGVLAKRWAPPPPLLDSAEAVALEAPEQEVPA